TGNSLSVHVRPSDNTDAETFYKELLLLQVYLYRLEFFILGNQKYLVPVFTEALDGHFLSNPGYHDLAVVNVLGSVYRQQVTVQNTDVLHTHTPHAQQVIGGGRKELRTQGAVIFNMLLRQDRAAGSNLTNNRQPQVGFGFWQTNSAAGTRYHFDG